MDNDQASPEQQHLWALREGELLRRPGSTPVLAGRFGYHRPDEILMAPDAIRASHKVLTDNGANVEAALDASDAELTDALPPGHWRADLSPSEAPSVGQVNAGLEAVRLVPLRHTDDDPRRIVDLVGQLRQEVWDPTVDEDRTVSLHHVLSGEGGIYQGGPAGAPLPADALSEPPMSIQQSLTPARPHLASLDTGLPVRVPEWVNPGDPDDVDVLAIQADTLASEAGHGLFIYGLIKRLDADLVIDPGRVLDPRGVGDEGSIVHELTSTKAPVICLSLGGYTDLDAEPTALAEAIRRLLGEGRVIVAAAGNNRSSLPFFPAALKGVIAVGAYDSTKDGRPVAQFSNHGSWVDVWAPGVALHSAFAKSVQLNEKLVFPGLDGDSTFNGFATWSGTSFAAPLVAAEIARRVRDEPVGGRPAQQVARAFLGELVPGPYPGGGAVYAPPRDLTRP